MAQFSKYTSLKLLISYLLLLGLMAIAVWFLFKQQANLNSQITVENTDKKQLIYTELIRDLYESDNYARIALQTIDEDSKAAFLQKNTSVISKIDFLKNNRLIAEESLLDTLKIYLKDKEQNILNLRKLQQTVDESPIGTVLQKIRNLEDVKGKLTLENFIKNPNQLSSYERKVAEDYINYLNKNVPKDSSNTISTAEADSILTVSKKILEDAFKPFTEEMKANTKAVEGMKELTKAIEESNSEWLFFIDSNEAIISGIDKLFVIENEKAFSVCVMNQYTITKELRLFKKSLNYCLSIA